MKTKTSPLFWPAKWDKGDLLVLDETLIPKKVHYIRVKNYVEAVNIIKTMKTRAFGQFLVVLSTFLLEINSAGNGRDRSVLSDEKLVTHLGKVAQALNNSRPTFPFSEVTGVVVGWSKKAIEQKIPLREFLIKNINGYLEGIKFRRMERVAKIAAVIKNGDSVLTHCNVSGELAMAASLCQQQGKKVKFFATETRPYFQGAKLTAWELKQVGADVTLIADNAVGAVMVENLINKVIVGSDRNCANGDFANKIGTYQIAVLAKEFNIPFYVLTQPSSRIAKGADIPIEMRDSKEILTYEGKKIIQGNVAGFYPGFDVIPHELVTEGIAINAGV